METHATVQVERRIRVATYEIDIARHVSNIAYIRWLEDLRLQLLDTYFPLGTQLAAGYTPVLTRTDIRYRRAIRLDDPVMGEMWGTGVRGIRVFLSARFRHPDDPAVVYAEADQEGVFISLETGKPIRVPPAFRSLLDAAHGPAAEP